MNSKILIPLAFSVSVLLPIRTYSQTPTPESLLKISNETYTAFQEKDEKKMQALTTEDFTYVGSEGVFQARNWAKPHKTALFIVSGSRRLR